MAKLYFRYAAMNAGKSLDLIKVAHNYEEKGMSVLIFKSSLDDRFDKNSICSRAGLKKEAILFDRDFDFYKHPYISMQSIYDCILIDEAQFLTENQVSQLRYIVDDTDTPIICYGLRTDYKLNLWEGSKALFALADNIEELKTVCWCGKKAMANARIKDGNIVMSGNQVEIGDDNYTSLCYKHYLENKISK